jgi:hypothetical protein
MLIKLDMAEWLPDRPGVVGALTQAQNVYPVAAGYSPFPSAVILSDAASENLLTCFAGKTSGSTTLFAGGATALFKFDANDLDLDDVSQMGGYTATSWDFTQYGKVVIAANGTDKLQAWTLGTSTVFADLAAAAPTAKFVSVVRDFVVAASDATDANKVYWSDINDETDWTPGAASQSDTQIIADGGDIMGLTGGEVGIVLLERSIVRMTYIGSPLFFQFDNISRGTGCFASGSIAQYKGTTYFLSDNGFYQTDGQSVSPIGAEKVDRFFFDDVAGDRLDEMSAAVDPIKKLVIWNYFATDGNPSQLIYSIDMNKWSYARANLDGIAELATSGVTLEGLDAYGTVDTIDRSFDSRVWSGGDLLLAGVRGDKIVTVDGANLPATITTGDVQLQGSRSVAIYGRLYIDNGSGSIAVASRDVLSASVNFGTAASSNSEGRVPLRSNGRFHRFQIIPSGTWHTAVAVDIELAPQGIR